MNTYKKKHSEQKNSIVINPSAQDIQDIRNGLIEHNSPYLKGLRRYDVANFSYSKTGEKLAGVTGEIWGDWLLVHFLWVTEHGRGKGTGTKVLLELELYAQDQGCHSCLLDTFSFQARPFYEKLGYEHKMTMSNFPVETQRHYFIKQLQQNNLA